MRWLIIINFILAVFFAMAALLQQSRFETQLLEQSLALQEQMTQVGLKSAWLSELGQAVDDGVLSPGFALSFDRHGEKLLSAFFPKRNIELDWKQFRTLQGQESLDFLEEALKKPRSWDRVLAIPLFMKAHGRAPQGIEGYEQTLVSAEAKLAFSRILKTMQTGVDGLRLGEKTSYQDVFLKLNAEGQILAFIPKIADVESLVLPAFAKKVGRNQASFQGLSLDFEPGPIARNQQIQLSYLPKIAWSLSLFCFLLGAWGFWQQRRKEQYELQNRIGFLNQLTHELHTPLASLKLHAQLMQKIGAQDESIAAIVQNADRMSKLFEEIKAINRPVQLSDQKVLTGEDIDEVLEKIISETGEACQRQGLVNASYIGDINRLHFILRNLVQNALRYGTRAELFIEEKPQVVTFTVSDNGPGVDKKDAQHIFKPFFRSTSATATSPDGLGLGLSLAQKAAAEMGSTITLANPGEAGAKFKFSLKREQSQS